MYAYMHLLKLRLALYSLYVHSGESYVMRECLCKEIRKLFSVFWAIEWKLHHSKLQLCCLQDRTLPPLRKYIYQEAIELELRLGVYCGKGFWCDIIHPEAELLKS